MKRNVFDVNKYKGQWVAFRGGSNEVVGHGATIEAAESAAKEKGEVNVEFYKVPESTAKFVGTCGLVICDQLMRKAR